MTGWEGRRGKETGKQHWESWFIEQANLQGISAPVVATCKRQPNNIRVKLSPRRGQATEWRAWRGGGGTDITEPQVFLQHMFYSVWIDQFSLSSWFYKGCSPNEGLRETPSGTGATPSNRRLWTCLTPYGPWPISEQQAPTRQQPRWILPRLAAWRILQITGLSLLLLAQPASKING